MTVTSKQQLLTSAEDRTKDNLLEVKWGPEKKIEFHRDPDEELGLTVVHGRMYTNNSALGSISGLFIKSVAPNSAAGKTGQFQCGDKILEVCGTYVDELSRENAIAFIRTIENPISFVVQSMTPVRKPYYDINGLHENESQEDTKLNQLSGEESALHENGIEPTQRIMEPEDKQSTEQAPTYIESEESEEDDADELESHDSVTVKKKFATIENKIEVEIERNAVGLGLSLAGHKNRNRMAVFVCGINPSSLVYKTGAIQVGDEILQVNDNVIYGHSHLNASSIIKRIAGPKYKFLVSRRKMAMEDVAVRPVTYFPAVLEEETSQQKYDNYPNVRDVPVEKGSSTLGIMIIEGKHAELGQGIFISDIQEDSAAEKAGLEIGEMLLGVNKETLVGTSYDQATALLKRVEGLVLLTLSAPTKRVAETLETPENNVESGKSPTPTPSHTSHPPSRAATPIPVDPATCAILPGQRTTIEINMEDKALGLFLAYAKNSSCKGFFVIDVYNGGSAEKDGRLQAGDEILEASDTVFKDVPAEVALLTVRQIVPKIKLVVFRPQTIKYETIEVDIAKAPGKGIGLSMFEKKDKKGTFVFDILEGGNAESDGRISKGDLLISISDANVESLSSEEVGAILKSVVGKVTLKFNRYSSVAR